MHETRICLCGLYLKSLLSIIKSIRNKGEDRMSKMRIALAAVMLAACVSFGTPVSAGGYTQLNINDGNIVIGQDGDYYITGNGTQTRNTIVVNSGVNANIKLENVNIYASSAFKIEENSTGNVNIELVGSNSLVSTDAPGIWKDGDSDNVGTLTISGSGSLLAENRGTDGAGIGSQNRRNTRNIVINGGTITAKAGTYGAGIGGGGGGGCGEDITINGGLIRAIGGDGQGAGIGGGSDSFGGGGNAEGITITGGTVIATAQGRGAGIGGGNGYGSNITITGGTVTATGSPGAADIGGNKASADDGRLIQTVETLNNSENPATNNIANALTYSDGKYSVKGDFHLDFDLTIEKDQTLEILQGAALTVDSSLINDGSFENNGTIYEPNGHVPREDDGDCSTPVLCKACQGIAVPAKIHQLSEVLYDDSFHWYQCENDNCTQILEKEVHQAGDWLIDQEATSTSEGKKHKECVVCHYVMETATIPKKVSVASDASENSAIPTDAAGNGSVKTGDPLDMSVYIALMTAAFVGIVGSILYCKKRKGV